MEGTKIFWSEEDSCEAKRNKRHKHISFEGNAAPENREIFRFRIIVHFVAPLETGIVVIITIIVSIIALVMEELELKQ